MSEQKKIHVPVQKIPFDKVLYARKIQYIRASEDYTTETVANLIGVSIFTLRHLLRNVDRDFWPITNKKIRTWVDTWEKKHGIIEFKDAQNGSQQ